MAVLASVELLTFQPVSARGAQMFEALVPVWVASGVRVARTTAYQGRSDLLMLWGPGAPSRWPAMQAQAERGRRTLVWDLAYWRREEKIRCSVDAAHPQAWVMRVDQPPDRLRADGIVCTDQWNPSGPVLVAGIGPKAKVQYGADRVDAWEATVIAECRRQGRVVRYRRKNGRGDTPVGLPSADTGTMESALVGMSLLVTWHSNAAIDAIRMGIPVVCKDGAAAAVCPEWPWSDGAPAPLRPEERDRFLSNLAFFQWAPSEPAAMWAWLKAVLA